MEQTPGFSGATEVLEAERRCKTVVLETSVVEFEPFDGTDFDMVSIGQIREMSSQLFGVLKLKLNTKPIVCAKT